MKILSDPDVERALIAGLIKHGSIAYHNVSDLGISDNTMTIDSHKVLYKCLHHIFENCDNIIPDIPSIYSSASEIGLRSWFHNDQEVSYLNTIINLPIEESNIRGFALKIKKLEIGRLMNERLEQAKSDTYNITGNESINEIFNIIERSIIDCGKFLNSQEKSASIVGDGIEEYFKELEENPIEQIGISTGFPIYDEAIGGGIRPGGVNVIAARPKTGKSTLAINMGIHISEMNIPVLYLDSEMGKTDTWHRMIACLSEINNKDIETGQYAKFYANKFKVERAINKVKTLPIFYQSIAGQPLENQISLIKRWIITDIGLQKNGKAKPCVIMYDYLKLMTEDEGKGFQEYQAIGFLLTHLVNFSNQYQIPILAFVQTNRDGVAKEDTTIVSQSDRISWFCSSLSIFKNKTPEEIELDGLENGSRKLVITDAVRFGPGLASPNYINVHFNKSISKITEGKTHFELRKLQKKSKIIQPDNNENFKSESAEEVSF